MQYLTIDIKTREGKQLFETIKKHKAVKILRTPNEETKEALRQAKAGKGELVSDVHKWFKNILK